MTSGARFSERPFFLSTDQVRKKKGQQHAYQRESRARASGPLVNFALFGHLGAGYRRTLTRWAEAFYPPARTVGGDVSEAGTGKVARNVAL